MFFLLLFLYYCPLLTGVHAFIFTGMHVVIFVGVHAVNYLCLNGLLCGQNCVNTGDYSGNT